VSGIVWLASYPKSGSTWLRAFLANLLYPSTAGCDINSLPLWIGSGDRRIFEQTVGLEASDLTHDEIDLYRPVFYRGLAASAAESIYIKVHDALVNNSAGVPQMPSDVTRAAVYIVRNPLDVAVSLANHLGKTVDEAIARMADPEYAFGSHTDRLHHNLRQRMLTWSGHVLSWLDQTDIPVHLMRYEDMLEQPLETFTRCVSFLGLDEDLLKIQTAINQASFESLRSQEIKHGFRERPGTASAFFRSGTSGQWKTALRADQIRRILKEQGTVMERLGYRESGER
jgi:aryl sulfotransferase